MHRYITMYINTCTCIYIYIYICVYTHICMYIHGYRCGRIQTQKSSHAWRLHVRMPMCMPLCASCDRMRACTQGICMYMFYIDIRMQSSIYIYMRTQRCVYLHIYVYIYIYRFMYTCIH